MAMVVAEEANNVAPEVSETQISIVENKLKWLLKLANIECNLTKLLFVGWLEGWEDAFVRRFSIHAVLTKHPTGATEFVEQTEK